MSRDQRNLAIELSHPLIEDSKVTPQRMQQPPKSVT